MIDFFYHKLDYSKVNLKKVIIIKKNSLFEYL